MRMIGEIRTLVVATAVILVGATSLAHAGATSSIFGPSVIQSLTSTGVGIPGTTRMITLTLNPIGNPTTGGQLQLLGFSGANAADFTIVPGGTCVAGTTVLRPITSTTGESCTVNVRYTPSSSASENAFLTTRCQPIALIGGFAVNCDGITIGNVASLLGTLVLVVAAAPIPALSAPMLTALSLSLLVLGAIVSLRRPSGRR